MREATYHVEYDKYGLYLFPSLVTMQYEGVNDGKEYIGREFVKTSYVELLNPDTIELPIMLIEEAPYSEEFWETYNRIKD